MSGITDSAKFNKNSSYYVEVDPTGGSGQIIQGNLQVTGNISAGGNSATVGLVSGGSLSVSGVSTLGLNGTSLTSVGAGGLAVLGSTTSTGLIAGNGGLAVTGASNLTGALTASGLTTANGGLNVTGVTALGGALNVTGVTTATGAISANGGLAVTGGAVVSGLLSTNTGINNVGSILSTSNIVSTSGYIAGVNALRDNAINVSDNVTDATITWAGVSFTVTGLIQGAGPNFTVFFDLPADIASNAVYRGMKIFDAFISIPSTTRVVIVAFRNSAGTTLLSTTLSSLSQWHVIGTLGAVGNASAPLGLYLTTQAVANMVTT